MVEDKPEVDKPALCMLAGSMQAQGKLVVDKLEEQHKRKLQQMEADSPAVNVIAYMYIVFIYLYTTVYVFWASP